MKFENTQVMNFSGAFRGMRNPKNSWNKSDSYFGLINKEWSEADYNIADYWAKSVNPNLKEDTEEYFQLSNKYDEWLIKNGVLQNEENGEGAEVAFIGPNDMKLAQSLIKAGPEHRKFMRQIFVSVDITAPLYWWKEADTYKVGTVANSTSTMHKLASTPITLDCFETDDYTPLTSCFNTTGDIGLIQDNVTYFDHQISGCVFEQILIPYCEFLRLKYLETKDKMFWKELIRILPESWLQTRTWTCNYENLLSICSKNQRRYHKLTEWSESFINWARSLPYAQELIFLDEISE